MVHIPWLLWLPRVGRAVSSGFLTSSRRLFRLSGVGTSGDGKRQSLDIGIVLGIWNPLSMRSASLGMETAVTEGDSDAILAVSRSTIGNRRNGGWERERETDKEIVCVEERDRREEGKIDNIIFILKRKIRICYNLS